MLKTVENRLTSLVRGLWQSLEVRLTNNPTPEIIKEMGRCLDLEDILKEEGERERAEREKSLRRVMDKAKYEEREKDAIVQEYCVFKERINGLTNPAGDFEDIVGRFEHLLFKTHVCDEKCEKVLQTDGGRGPGSRLLVCQEEGKLLEPREPHVMKLLHLFYKEPSLYSDIKSFLHLFLR